jgi:hypothetical protein
MDRPRQMGAQMNDDVMARLTAAVERGRAGDRADARAVLEALWTEIGEDDGDAFHRCVIAHFTADLQEDDRSELLWDERALAAVTAVTDERAQMFDESLQVRSFMPSLYLSIADDHRRLGDAEQAAHFLARARSASDALGDDSYGSMVKNIMENIAAALAAGSTERLS